MSNEFTAIIVKDGDWYVAVSPEIPEATGQGRTIAEAKESLASAIAFELQLRRDEHGNDLGPDAIRDVVTVS